MKINFTFKKSGDNFFHALWKKKTQKYLDPTRDWFVILVSGVTVFVCGVLYFSYDYYDQAYMHTEVTSDAVQSPVYRESEVKEQAKLFYEKEQTFSSLRKEMPVASLPAVDSSMDTTDVVLDPNQDAPPLAE